MMARPRVVVVMDVTVDGRIILGRQRGEADPHWTALDGGATRTLHRRIRTLIPHQAIFAGSETILRMRGGTPKPDRFPSATGNVASLYEDYLPLAIAEKPGQAWFVVPDSRGRIRWVDRERGGMHLLVLAARKTPSGYLQFLHNQMIPYFIVGEERVDFPTALERLQERLGVTWVLCEGGGRLNGTLLRAGLVDEVNLIVLPGLSGGEETPTSFEAPELRPDEMPVHLKLISVETLDDVVWLRYEVVAPGSPGTNGDEF